MSAAAMVIARLRKPRNSKPGIVKPSTCRCMARTMADTSSSIAAAATSRRVALRYTKLAVNKLVKDALNVAFDASTALAGRPVGTRPHSTQQRKVRSRLGRPATAARVGVPYAVSGGVVGRAGKCPLNQDRVDENETPPPHPPASQGAVRGVGVVRTRRGISIGTSRR